MYSHPVQIFTLNRSSSCLKVNFWLNWKKEAQSADLLNFVILYCYYTCKYIYYVFQWKSLKPTLMILKECPAIKSIYILKKLFWCVIGLKTCLLRHFPSKTQQITMVVCSVHWNSKTTSVCTTKLKQKPWHRKWTVINGRIPFFCQKKNRQSLQTRSWFDFSSDRGFQ